jgi:RNA polymerase sigma factor (sigma-70 family)
MLTNVDQIGLQEYSRYLYRYALQQVRDTEVAADLVQDTFVAALEGGCRFQGRSAIRTWLVGILKHKIADSFRERVRAPVSFDALADADGGDASGTEVAERPPAPPAAQEPANAGLDAASGKRARRVSSACPPGRRERSS